MMPTHIHPTTHPPNHTPTHIHIVDILLTMLLNIHTHCNTQNNSSACHRRNRMPMTLCWLRVRCWLFRYLFWDYVCVCMRVCGMCVWVNLYACACVCGTMMCVCLGYAPMGVLCSCMRELCACARVCVCVHVFIRLIAFSTCWSSSYWVS